MNKFKSLVLLGFLCVGSQVGVSAGRVGLSKLDGNPVMNQTRPTQEPLITTQHGSEVGESYISFLEGKVRDLVSKNLAIEKKCDALQTKNSALGKSFNSLVASVYKKTGGNIEKKKTIEVLQNSVDDLMTTCDLWAEQ